MPPRVFSRHLYSEGLTNDDQVTYLTDRVRFTFREAFDNRFYKAVQGDTLFVLAGRAFPSFERPSGLWWVIADYQPEIIHDPTLRLTPGKTYVVPSERLVREEIFSETRRVATSA